MNFDNLGSFGEKKEYTDRLGLVYARVSSKRQKIEGHGLEGQEQRCLEGLQRCGIKYDRTFADDYTGAGDFMKRPAMRQLLEYVDKNRYKSFVIMFDDLKRFARDTEFHIKLRAALKARNVIPLCLNYDFDDSPEGVYSETLNAAHNQLEREQNKRQVIQKQRARLMLGYWGFCAPLGYEKLTDPIHGELDVPTAKSQYIKEALEGFASNRFVNKIEIAKFLQKHKVISDKQDPAKATGTVTYMLKNVFYAGYIEFPKWEVERRLGHHEAIIDLNTYNKIQSRLKRPNSTRVRLDIRDDFELRGLVNCSGCGKKLTGAPSRSKTGALHPYYKCSNKECNYYGKSIKASDIHDKFKDLVKNIKAKNQIMSLSAEILQDVWRDELKSIGMSKDKRLKEKEELEKQLEDLTLLASKATSDILLKQYEKQITKFGEKLNEMESLIAPNYDYQIPYRTSVEEVFNVLQNPYSVWTNYDVYQKQRFFNFIFSDNLIYDKKEGYRTPNYSLPIKVFENKNMTKTGLVETVGIEPTSKSFV